MGGPLAKEKTPTGSKLLPALALLALVIGGTVWGIQHLPQAGGRASAFRVVALKGKVLATDGMEDQDLTKGSEIRAGLSIKVGPGAALKLQAGDPRASLILFQNSVLVVKQFTQEAGQAMDIYKLKGRLEKGGLVLNLRTRNSLWGVDIEAPTGVRFVGRKLVFFKLKAKQGKAEVVVGDGVVAALDTTGEKVFIKADQKMRSSSVEPLQKASAANVLQEEWSF
jgi:hypothetical protein